MPGRGRYNPLAEGHVTEAGKYDGNQLWKLTVEGLKDRAGVENELVHLGYIQVQIGDEQLWMFDYEDKPPMQSENSYNPIKTRHIRVVGELHGKSIWQVTAEGEKVGSKVTDELTAQGFVPADIGPSRFWLQDKQVMCNHHIDPESLTIAECRPVKKLGGSHVRLTLSTSCRLCGTGGRFVVLVANNDVRW